MLELGPNSVPEPEPQCITVPVSLRQKDAVPAVPVPDGITDSEELFTQYISHAGRATS
jgi:hypothetical protein